MVRKKNQQTILLVLLAVAVVFMSIGFATYARVLNINGTVNVASQQWKVHFDPDSFAESTGSVTAASVNAGETLLTFTANLNNFNDKYEFDIDVVNDGTIDAALKTITLGGLSQAQAAYIDYIVTYDGTPYTATTENLNNIIAVDGTKTVHVKVQYKQPDNSAALPEEDQELNLTVALSYEQV